MTGSENWCESGKQEHCKGEGRFNLSSNVAYLSVSNLYTAELNAAKTKGYVDGTVDRAKGKWDSVTGAITGDKEQQVAGNIQEDKGAVQQSLNK